MRNYKKIKKTFNREKMLSRMADIEINHEDLALRCRMSEQSAFNWVYGYNIPKIKSIKKIATAIGVDKKELLSVTNGQ